MMTVMKRPEKIADINSRWEGWGMLSILYSFLVKKKKKKIPEKNSSDSNTNSATAEEKRMHEDT